MMVSRFLVILALLALPGELLAQNSLAAHVEFPVLDKSISPSSAGKRTLTPFPDPFSRAGSARRLT